MRSLWLLAISFAALLALIAIHGYTAMRRARTIHDEMVEVHESYLRTDTFLRAIPDNMYLGGLMVRDYLLDTSPSSASHHRQQLRAVQSSVEEQLSKLEPEVGDQATPSLKRLRLEVQAYWDSLEPIFKWTPEQKQKLGPQFLLHDVLPRWNAVVSLAQEITALNEADLRQDQRRLEASQEEFQRFLGRMLALVLVIGLLVAILATHRFITLERRSQQHQREVEHAEHELRRLSRRVVQAQEEERKFISRELHDSVGQTLTAIGLELGSLGASQASGDFQSRVQEIKGLNEDILISVRDLAMGLRPSMLDDMGLGPALEWQGRQFSRRLSIPISVDVEGTFDDLPDSHRTCVFRVVQEALTNCAKHAHAKHVRVLIRYTPDAVRAIIQDDGVGFDAHKSSVTGIGLLGMQERAQELEGKLSIMSEKQKGTKVELEVPVPRKAGV
ncbi:MAG: sensor histidine kinase [Terriglobales bacterium]